MSNGEEPDRAERLRLFLHCCGGAPELDPVEAMAAGLTPLDPSDVDLLHQLEAADLDLGNACAAVESELRAEAWAAVERLLALVEALPGALAERIGYLPEPEFAAAARILFALGWVDR